MNKNDLVNEISSSTGISKSKSTEVVDNIMNIIQESLSKGDKVSLTGFGSWDTVTRKSRKGRNPKTGEEINIPEKKVVKFRPGSNFNKSINS